MKENVGRSFEVFWRELRASTLLGGIIRATRYTGDMVYHELKYLNFTHDQACFLAQVFNDIPEDCKTSEDTIQCFLKSNAQLLECVHQVCV